jgi:hypothetical protein
MAETMIKAFLHSLNVCTNVCSQEGREADYSNERFAPASLISSRPLTLSQPMRHEGEKNENE